MAKVCICNNFNDQAVKDAIQHFKKTGEPSAPIKISDIYKTCSGGEGPQCGKCLPEIREALENSGHSPA